MYLVLELQSYSDNIYHLESLHDNLPQAEQKYHTVLAAAAVSNVPIHSAILMDSSGYVIKKDTYTRD